MFLQIKYYIIKDCSVLDKHQVGSLLMKKNREENSLGTVPLLKKSQSLDILRWVTAEGLVPVTVRILADTIDYFPFLSQSGFWDPHGIYVDNCVTV